jgi:hypothetical protein
MQGTCVWHKEYTRANPHVMVHPSDAEAWKNFSLVFLEFALESRNVRVAVATDDFNPFVFGAPYFCWPVFVIPLNLHKFMEMRYDMHIYLLFLLVPLV